MDVGGDCAEGPEAAAGSSPTVRSRGRHDHFLSADADVAGIEFTAETRSR